MGLFRANTNKLGLTNIVNEHSFFLKTLFSI